jgi:hypothetical protein
MGKKFYTYSFILSVTKKEVPFLNVLLTVILPPWLKIIFWQLVSPNPFPLGLLVK